MKLLRSTRIFSVLLLSMGIAQVASADTLKLKLGNEGTYPPFAITATDGTLSGMEPDLARALCDRMNAECEIVTMDFSALLPSLIAGKLDMIVSQLTRKPERMKATQFTRDVLENSAIFVVSQDWNKGFSTDDLKGVKVAVQKGSAHASWIEENRPEAEPVYYENPNQQKLDLLAGRVDTVFGAKLNWVATFIDTPEGDSYKLIPGSGEESLWLLGSRIGAGWAVQKGEIELSEKVNAALNSMIKDCTYTKIRLKYLSEPTLTDEPKECL